MLRRVVSAPAVAVAAASAEQRRHTGGAFQHPGRSSKRKHTEHTLTTSDASRFGGRSAMLRDNHHHARHKRTTPWKKDPKLRQYNVDIWTAQQSLRRKWKGRDYEVVEMPYSKAPAVLRRVIPEMHTEFPQPTDPAAGDWSNVRDKVFAVEDMQQDLFPSAAKAGAVPYPAPLDRSVGPAAATGKRSLDLFFK